MTTSADKIAQAIRDGFHELATAVQGRDSAGTPRNRPESDSGPLRAPADPSSTPEASRDVTLRAARILVKRAQAILDANQQPMTVGQLGAQHIGKRIHVGENTGPGALRVGRITHWRTSTVLTHGYASPMYPHDTPCTVEPDHD